MRWGVGVERLLAGGARVKGSRTGFRPYRDVLRASGPLAVLAALGIGAWHDADAQEIKAAADASSVAEALETPDVMVLGFEDKGADNCNPKIARYGRCVEEVRFLDLAAAWDPEVTPNDVQRAIWENTALLYAEIWEDMAYRASVTSDPVYEALVARGATKLPVPKQQWEATARNPGDDDHSVYALPRSSSWSNASAWIDPRTWIDPVKLTPTELLTPSRSHFQAVRVSKAAGLLPSSPAVILKGRFAARLAADGKRVPYDIMDGDPAASGPLFEQMYPYARGLAQELGATDDSEVPLTRFLVEEGLKTAAAGDRTAEREANYDDSLLEGDDATAIGGMRAFATHEFERFYRLVGTQILRFAREEYTPTHIRVLTALMAMESPPGTLAGGYLNADDVVAASKGQMDVTDPSITAFRGFTSSKTGYAINFVELPQELVERHISDFEEWRNPSEQFKLALLKDIIYNLEDHLRDGMRSNPDRYRFQGLDDESLKAWIQDNSFPGRVPIVTRYFKRIALDLLVSRLDPVKREKIETGILLDHLNHDIKRSFGGADAAMVDPGTVEERSTEEWLGVLGSHGMYPEPIADRPGVVNPLAICTLSDRLDALKEPVFNRIRVDELVVGSNALTTVEELLWEAREKLPFIMIDDPTRNPPEVTRLVGLPGDRAVYRIRWEIWAGWHLLWGVEGLGESKDASRRMALRTGALCTDLVISSPDLVPTLLRASMLDGEFRPTEPVRDVGKTIKPTKKKSNDQVKVDGDKAIDAVEGERQDVSTAIDAAGGDATAQVEVARNLIGGLMALKPGSKRLRGVDTTPVDNEAVLYLRGLFFDPIRAKVGTRPLLVTVFDHGTPDPERETIWDLRPRTPYHRLQRRFVADDPATAKRSDDVRYLRSAAWAMTMQPAAENTPAISVSPAYLPTELLGTAELKQVWKRRRTSDWFFGGGVGFVPYRRVQYGCNEEYENTSNSSAIDCRFAGAIPNPVSETQGVGLDLHALNTQWLVGDRRMAIEFGPEVRFDLLPSGRSAFLGDSPQYGVTNPDGDDIAGKINYRFGYRFQAGILVGIRFAPHPAPLWRDHSRKYPWGAPLPDGSSGLGRVQYGFRAGLLLGPTSDGFESTVLMEAWLGWALRSKAGPQSSFTPYHSSILLGPFIRGQAGIPITNNPSNYLRLEHSGMAIIGLRGQMRLTAKPEIKLEVPE